MKVHTSICKGAASRGEFKGRHHGIKFGGEGINARLVGTVRSFYMGERSRNSEEHFLRGLLNYAVVISQEVAFCDNLRG